MYINTQTMRLCTESEVRAAFPNTSFAIPFSPPDGYEVVFEGPQASGGTVYQQSQAAGVEQINNKWYTKYVLGPIFTDNEEATATEQETAYKAMKDEEQAKNVRSSRDTLLSESDWTQLADSTADKAIWATYRQALRDVPAQAGFPWTVVWPEKP